MFDRHRHRSEALSLPNTCSDSRRNIGAGQKCSLTDLETARAAPLTHLFGKYTN
jgi:hypothetical protein